jgi:hypothetical protein
VTSDPHLRAHGPDREQDPDQARLRIQARLHDGVVPVSFLGTTWQQHDGRYWLRRIGAIILLLVLTLFVGAIAAGFTAGIIAGIGHQPAGIIVGTLYALTAVPGFINGRHRVAKAPLDRRGRAPRTAFPSGCLALVFAPFSTGLTFAVLAAMFGPDFLGEQRAREVTKTLQHD